MARLGRRIDAMASFLVRFCLLVAVLPLVRTTKPVDKGAKCIEPFPVTPWPDFREIGLSDHQKARLADSDSDSSSASDDGKPSVSIAEESRARRKRLQFSLMNSLHHEGTPHERDVMDFMSGASAADIDSHIQRAVAAYHSFLQAQFQAVHLFLEYSKRVESNRGRVSPKFDPFATIRGSGRAGEWGRTAIDRRKHSDEEFAMLKHLVAHRMHPHSTCWSKIMENFKKLTDAREWHPAPKLTGDHYSPDWSTIDEDAIIDEILFSRRHGVAIPDLSTDDRLKTQLIFAHYSHLGEAPKPPGEFPEIQFRSLAVRPGSGIVNVPVTPQMQRRFKALCMHLPEEKRDGCWIAALMLGFDAEDTGNVDQVRPKLKKAGEYFHSRRELQWFMRDV